MTSKDHSSDSRNLIKWECGCGLRKIRNVNGRVVPGKGGRRCRAKDLDTRIETVLQDGRSGHE